MTLSPGPKTLGGDQVADEDGRERGEMLTKGCGRGRGTGHIPSGGMRLLTASGGGQTTEGGTVY